MTFSYFALLGEYPTSNPLRNALASLVPSCDPSSLLFFIHVGLKMDRLDRFLVFPSLHLSHPCLES
jgi:hypothetical protein